MLPCGPALFGSLDLLQDNQARGFAPGIDVPQGGRKQVQLNTSGVPGYEGKRENVSVSSAGQFLKLFFDRVHLGSESVSQARHVNPWFLGLTVVTEDLVAINVGRLVEVRGDQGVVDPDFCQGCSRSPCL